MEPDTALILGLILAVLSVPAMVSAYSDRRPPRAPILILLIAATLVVYAVLTHPGGYRLADIPDVFYAVVARIIP
ncbi:MAG: hypothetical protein AAF408_11185 [Pseudomonadota bacterium]